jgi:hypothetical protein
MKTQLIRLFVIAVLVVLSLPALVGVALAAPNLQPPWPMTLPTDRCTRNWMEPINAAAAEAFGLSQEEVVNRLHEGAVLAELAGNPAQLRQFQGSLIQIRTKQIDEAVSNGYLSAEQAGKLKAALPTLTGQMIENGGGPYWGQGIAGGRAWGLWRAEVAAYLSLSVEDLAAALSGGQSLGALTEAQGQSVAGLTDLLLSAVRTRLDQAVANGFLSQAQADRLYNLAAKNISRIIYSTGPCSVDPTELTVDR